jgi:hypothetical protein
LPGYWGIKIITWVSRGLRIWWIRIVVIVHHNAPSIVKHKAIYGMYVGHFWLQVKSAWSLAPSALKYYSLIIRDL